MQVTDTTVRKVQIVPNGDTHAIYQAAVVDPSGARVQIKATALRGTGGESLTGHVTIKFASSLEVNSLMDMLRTVAEILQQEENAALMRGDQAPREVAAMTGPTK